MIDKPLHETPAWTMNAKIRSVRLIECPKQGPLEPRNINIIVCCETLVSLSLTPTRLSHGGSSSGGAGDYFKWAFD